MSLPDDGTLVYAGIGSRQTPDATLEDIATMSSWLAKNGWHLSSGVVRHVGCAPIGAISY